MTRNIKFFLLGILIGGILCLMNDFTWGSVPKAQDDPQLITEAITAAIAAHNDDPDAHLGTGQSLQSHRASEIIDHEALSIVPDKINSANNIFDLAVNGDISGQGDNFSDLFPGFLAEMDQNSPLTGDATFNVYNFETSDFLYNDGDIILDFIMSGTGSSGTWKAIFSCGFARIEIKSGNIRFGYYDGSWHDSSFVSFSPGTIHKFRIHYDSVNSRLIFYINGVSVHDISYTITPEDDQFNLFLLLNRGSSSSSAVNFGNIKFAFDSTDL